MLATIDPSYESYDRLIVPISAVAETRFIVVCLIHVRSTLYRTFINCGPLNFLLVLHLCRSTSGRYYLDRSSFERVRPLALDVITFRNQSPGPYKYYC